MNVTIARYLLGVAELLVACGSLSLAAVALRRRFFTGLTAALARLVEIVIGLALLIGVLEAVGAVGLFRPAGIVAGSALVGAVITLAVGRAPQTREAAGARAAPVGALSAGFAVIVAAAVVAEWASPALQSYDVGIRTFDSLWYHLPWAAAFAQTGHVTPLRFTDVEYLTAFYPATAELLHGLGISLLGRDTLSPAINLLWLGAMLLAAYCVGRPRGLGALTLLGAGLAAATPMMDFSQAGSAANDIAGVFFLLAAVALFVDAPERTATHVLAAVATGLAIAVKLSMVLPALALTVGAIAVTPRRPRPTAAALWVGPMVLAGGFWYVRNLIALGNPVPWTSLGFLPTPAASLQQHTGFSVAHYATNSGAWSHFLEPGLAAGLGRWWWALVAAAVLGPLLCLLPGAGRVVRMLGLVALASLAAYLVTPESAAGPAGHPSGFAFNLRYAAPGLTLAFVVTPLAPVFAGRRRARALAVALVALLVATVWHASLWPGQHVAGALAVGAASALLALAALALRNAPRAVLLASAAALIAALALVGYPWQRHYLRGRYAYHPGVSYLAPVWALFRSVHHARVGVVGTFGGFFSYPLYGVDASNQVQYIGHRGARGSFTPIRTCRAWRAAVNAAHLRYLVTTPARDPWHPTVLAHSPEGAWTSSDPGARVVLRLHALGQTIAVFRLIGPLGATGCG